MKTCRSLLTLLILPLLWATPHPAKALVLLSNGYQCDGSTISKNEQVLSEKIANSKVQKSIRKIKGTLDRLRDSGAPKKKISRAKKKLRQNRQLKNQIATCAEGSLDVAIEPFLQQLVGSFSGNYTDDVLGTGSMGLTFELDGSNFNGTLTLGGIVGFLLDEDTLEFHGDVQGLSLPIVFALPGSALGDLLLTIDTDGIVEIVAETPPDGFEEIFFSGVLNANSISGTYGAVQNGGLALLQGEFEVVR